MKNEGGREGGEVGDEHEKSTCSFKHYSNLFLPFLPPLRLPCFTHSTHAPTSIALPKLPTPGKTMTSAALISSGLYQMKGGREGEFTDSWGGGEGWRREEYLRGHVVHLVA